MWVCFVYPSKFVGVQKKELRLPLAGGIDALCETARHGKGLSVQEVLAALAEETR